VPQGKELEGIRLSATQPKAVKYSVGQPMGALSSWAMLAITHHFIIQSAAWIAGVCPKGTFFSEYAVLGDDVVIWNKPVSRVYLRILKMLGVEVGLAKSIISPYGVGLEFAKKTLWMGWDVSPIPFKEQSSAHRNFALMRTFGEKYRLTLLQALRFLGYGYKVDPSKNSRTVKLIHLALSVPRTYQELLNLISSTAHFFDLSPRARLKVMEVLSVHVISTEVSKTQLRAKEMKAKLVQYLPGLQVDSPYIIEAHIKVSVLEGTILDYIRSLDETIKRLEILKRKVMNIWMYSKRWSAPTQPAWMSWGHRPYESNSKEFEDMISNMTQDLRELFKAWEVLDSIQLELIISPKPSTDSTISYREEKRTLILWERWFHTLSMLTVGRPVYSDFKSKTKC